MGRSATHKTCEGHHRLDVRGLVRDGLLTASGTVTWTCGNQVTGRITVSGDGNSFTLAYGLDGQDVVERVALSRTAVNFEGKRAWFLCPGCNRRVGVLYAGKRFRCRHCLDLRYHSQRESVRFRAISKMQRARRKLGGSGDLAQPRPFRPRYMHQRTYERFVKEEDEAWQVYVGTG